jgi:ADP-ribosylglycohydrolase
MVKIGALHPRKMERSEKAAAAELAQVTHCVKQEASFAAKAAAAAAAAACEALKEKNPPKRLKFHPAEPARKKIPLTLKKSHLLNLFISVYDFNVDRFVQELYNRIT